jgi:hypothetical protein
MSPAKTQRPQRSENKGENFPKIIHLFPPNLAPLKMRGVKMGFRIVAWMKRSGIREGGMGRGRSNGARD